MRRRSAKVKVPRLRRAKITSAGKPRMFVPYMGNRTGVVLNEGVDQSVVYFDDDRSDEFLPREMCLPNTLFRRGTPRERLKSSIKRVRLKTERVQLRVKRVRLR